MARWSVLREPTVPILLAACVVHVVRRDALDFAVFFGTAVLIVVDSRRHGGVRGGSGHVDQPTASRWQRVWLPLVGVTLFSGAAALAAVASLGARLIVTLIGIAGLVLVWARTPRLPSRRSDGKASARGWPVWAVIGVVACLWELTSFIAQQAWPLDQEAHPAVSDLVGPLLGTWFGRVVFLMLWAAAGWWLLRQMVGAGTVAGQDAARGASRKSGPDGERSEPGRRHTGFDSGHGGSDGHSEAAGR